MKYFAICALLLVVPLAYGGVVPQPRSDADADLVPDMSTAEDGKMSVLVPDMSVASDADEASLKRQVPPFRFMSEQLVDNADIDQVPDMSVAADAKDNETAKVEEVHSADAAAVPDMSVAADGEDNAANSVPDMSVAADGEDKAAQRVPDMSVAADAE